MQKMSMLMSSVQTEEEEIESKEVPGLPMDWNRLFENVILLISIQPVKEPCDDKGIENRSNNANSWNL